MRMLEAGEVAPTVAHCVWLPAPQGGRIFAWGGPAQKPAPTLRRFAGRCGPRRRAGGFTLLELLLVVAIIAVATAGVGFAMRDSSETQLEREAVRLAALLESARARSQASGVPVVWRSTPNGFVFSGLPAGALAEGWLSKVVGAAAPTTLVLGPEPITWPQRVRLVSGGGQARALDVASDGVRPYAVKAVGTGDGASLGQP